MPNLETEHSSGEVLGSFSAYINSVRRFPVLSSAEQRRAFTLLRQGGTLKDLMSDPLFQERLTGEDETVAEQYTTALTESSDLKEMLFNCNQRLLVREARSDDPERRIQMIQDGSFQLMRAIDGYDPARPGEFSTYFLSFGGKAMRASDRESSRPRIPARAYKKIREIREMEDNLTVKNGREPSADEIREAIKVEYGYSDKVLDGVFEVMGSGVMSVRSIDAPLNSNVEDLSLGETIADTRAGTEEAAEEILRNVELMGNVEKLPSRLQLIINRHYKDGKNFAEIGRELGITRSRIGQLHDTAIKSLRKYIAGEKPNVREFTRAARQEFYRDERYTSSSSNSKIENASKYDTEDTRVPKDGGLPPLLQRLVDDASHTLQFGRAHFKKQFPNAFFPDETMTDQERMVFMGKRNLEDPRYFQYLCKMWGMTVDKGERIYSEAEQKYYSFALE
jgi:RNA polymerase sigma factor (sigma-70 family)